MLASLLLLLICNSSFSQWQLSLTMQTNETIAGISSPTDNVIWAITNNFFVYTTNNQGSNWKRIKCNGLAANVFLSQLYALNETTAFMGVNTGFTGVGPGIIYKTTDGGKNWQQVFTHVGNCDIIIGMFDDNKGLMACSFSSFNGTVPAGQTLYYTLNGGAKWNVYPKTLSTDIAIIGLITKDKKAGIIDYNNFYASVNSGVNFTTKDKLTNTASTKYTYQFEDSNYALLTYGGNAGILVKRPGTKGWIDQSTTPGLTGDFVSAIVLDKNECWITEALDNNKLFYSSDSAKTFMASVPVPNTSFQYLTKARAGRILVAGSPSFSQGKIWINKRQVLTASKSYYQHNKTSAAID